MVSTFVQTTYTLSVALKGSLLVCLGGLAYLRRVRLDRPAIGTFNRRDILVTFGFIIMLPVRYLNLPRWLVLCLLTVTFTAALSIGYRPLLSRTQLWVGIGLLLGLNLYIGRTMLGTVAGWQLSWAETDVIVVLTVIAVTNLWVQGGMRLKHVAWFTFILAAYDALFILIVPLTNHVQQGFLGWPLNPSFGMRYGLYNATVGIGDLLVFGLFTLAAYKAYGKQATKLAFAVVVIFGCVLTSFSPLVFNLVDSRTDLVVPAQTAFGPAAFLLHLWLRHHYGRERTVQEFLTGDDVVHPAPVEAAPVPAAQPQPEPVSLADTSTPVPRG